MGVWDYVFHFYYLGYELLIFPHLEAIRFIPIRSKVPPKKFSTFVCRTSKLKTQNRCGVTNFYSKRYTLDGFTFLPEFLNCYATKSIVSLSSL